MEAAGWIAVVAAAGAYGHIAWDIYSSRRHERTDVRIAVRHEPVAVASGSYVITVVVTNHGPNTEQIERIGIWFHDATGIFPTDWFMGNQDQGVSKEVDFDLEPRKNFRWEYDFGDVRFRHGLGYRAWVQLATGPPIESSDAVGVADAKGLEVAGLVGLMQPISEQNDG